MRWALVAIGSGVAAQLWGLVVQLVGAGNSVAVFGLGLRSSRWLLRLGTVGMPELPTITSLA